MEDTTIVKGFYCYSFRVDYVAEGALTMIKRLREWLKKYSVPHYACVEEVADKTKKLHFQSIIWLKTKINEKVKTAMRNWWGREKGHISFTKAKKPKNLLSYINKTIPDTQEGQSLKTLIITNLTKEQLALAPKWIVDLKKVWKDELEIEAKSLATQDLGIQDYCCRLIDYYNLNNKTPPMRTTLYKFLLRYHHDFSSKDYFNEMGMFRHQQSILDNQSYTYDKLL